MTREEAIIDLNALMFILDNDQYTDEIEEALNIGISALKQMGKTQPPGENATSDCISRQAEYVDLSERVTATYYDEEHEEWSRKTIAIKEVLDAVCDEYTILPFAQPAQRSFSCGQENDLISRQAAIAKFKPWLKVEEYSEGELNMLKAILYELMLLPPAQPELIEKASYVRGFEQGRTQGMIDAKEGKK